MQYTTLSNKIRKHFSLSEARLSCLVQIVLGLISVSSVNLKRLTPSLSGKSKFDSKYRKLQRFFSEFTFSSIQLARFIAHFFNTDNKPWVLALDRTNWAYGKTPINILTLAIVQDGTAIPLLWKLLPKKGTSNTQERIHIVDLFLKIFPINKIQMLLCDREFIGFDWVRALIERSIPFCIRVRENMKIYCPKGKLLNKGIRRLGRGCSLIFKGNYYICDKTGVQAKGISVAAHRRKDNGELVIIITNEDPYQALENYAKRWGIEVLFAHLKKRGFNIEDTHLTEPERISTMLAMVSIAYLWALKIGKWRAATQTPIRLKSHGRKEISIFRLGLNYLREIFYNTNHHK